MHNLFDQVWEMFQQYHLGKFNRLLVLSECSAVEEEKGSVINFSFLYFSCKLVFLKL
jgi:hypothetical protein